MNNNNNYDDNMTFKNGDYVSCKKWNGDPVLGIYAYTGHDGSHFIVTENNKRWNIKPNDIEFASTEEIKIIKTKIIPQLGNFKVSMVQEIKNNQNAKTIKNLKDKLKEEDELLLIMTMAT